MVTLLKYFFFRLYRLSFSSNSRDPVYAIGIISLFILSNVFTVFCVIQLLFQVSIEVDRTVLIIFLVSTYGFTCYAFKRHSAAIMSEPKFNSRSRTVLNVFLFLYVLISITSFVISINFVREMQ